MLVLRAAPFLDAHARKRARRPTRRSGVARARSRSRSALPAARGAPSIRATTRWRVGRPETPSGPRKPPSRGAEGVPGDHAPGDGRFDSGHASVTSGATFYPVVISAHRRIDFYGVDGLVRTRRGPGMRAAFRRRRLARGRPSSRRPGSILGAEVDGRPRLVAPAAAPAPRNRSRTPRSRGSSPLTMGAPREPKRPFAGAAQAPGAPLARPGHRTRRRVPACHGADGRVQK